MRSPSQQQKATASVGRLFVAVFRWLASLRLAVILLVFLAVVLAATTVIEKHQGVEFVHWYVYDSRWFMALLGLLAANVLAAALIRLPWKRRHIGFLITHLGVVVLLGGALWTSLGGIEGQLPIAEGDTADTMFITNRCLLKAVFDAPAQEPPLEFTFYPGPRDWPQGKTLDFPPVKLVGSASNGQRGQDAGGTRPSNGEHGQDARAAGADEVRLKVLGFYLHSHEEVSWVTDPSAPGWPAIRFAIRDPSGTTITDEWLAGSQLGGEVTLGPARFELVTTSAAAMLGDFLDPPLAGAGESGVLSVCYQDQVYHVDVKENVGKKVLLGEKGLWVQIVDYLPDAARGTEGRFVSRTKRPGNPMLELLVHLPGRDEPIREIAFARFPSLSRDAVHGGASPVKFWYYHPAVSGGLGAQFLQTPDGRLYCRVGAGGKYVSRGEVKEGDRIETWAGFTLGISEYVESARREATFHSVTAGAAKTSPGEAAARVEISVDGETEQAWLQRNGREQVIQTPRGPVALTFGYDRLPLGFSLKLLDFEHGRNPGRVGDASFASSVQLIDTARGTHQTREISMNHPLVHGKFTFYQSEYRELPDGTEISYLSVTHDPGRFLKYFGSLMTCVGTFIVFYLKGLLSRGGTPSASKRRIARRGKGRPIHDRRASCEVSSGRRNRSASRKS